MTDLDDAALWAGAAPALVVPKRCRRHEWGDTLTTLTSTAADGGIAYRAAFGVACSRCGKQKDDRASRRGRTNRQRGNAIEREWAKRLGLRRVGHHGGPEDATNDLFVGQAKSLATGRFPGWMTDELAKLPRTEGRIPILGVLEAPGPGKRGRRIVVIDEADWIALHGGTE